MVMKCHQLYAFSPRACSRYLQAALILLLALAGHSIAAPTTQPATQPKQIDYFALSPDEFFNLDEVNKRIDYDRPNQTLLSAGIFHETNRSRAAEKLPPLQHLEKLDEAAMLHVRDMVEKNYLAHDEKGTKYPHPMDRVRTTGLRPQYVAENIALAFGIQYEGGRDVYPLKQWRREGLSYRQDGPAIPPQTYRTFAAHALKQWMDSPGHRANILDPHSKFMGSAAIAAMPTGKVVQDAFHKFYAGQVFFTPQREQPKREGPTNDQQGHDDSREDAPDPTPDPAAQPTIDATSDRE
jgi:uncharacterized protein YkwD